MLSIHENSPKHKKKAEAHDEIMKLKEDYMKELKEKKEADQTKSKGDTEDENEKILI